MWKVHFYFGIELHVDQCEKKSDGWKCYYMYKWHYYKWHLLNNKSAVNCHDNKILKSV